MPGNKRSVLITGCSDGGLGAALAVAFHEAGLHVYATARNPSKMRGLQAKGIETMTVDVMDDKSIAAAVAKLSSLDILVNNAGATYSMPFSDMSLIEAKKLFDLNVWSYVAVTQAFLPLLLRSKGMIVNNTSIASVATVPFQSAYNASKAAIAMFSSHQRLELAPFGVKVVDLKTGAVASNIFQNMDQNPERGTMLPPDSIYAPAKHAIEKTLRGEDLMKSAVPANNWAADVVSQLLKPAPSYGIWRGGSAFLVWITTLLPTGMIDGTIKKMVGLDVLESALKRK